MYSWKRLRDHLVYGVSKRTLVIVLALVTVLASVTGGTVAMLQARKQVTNVFTYGDLSIDLYETDTRLDNDDSPDTNWYMMIPRARNPIAKDPTVRVDAGSVDCWLFVVIEKSANYDRYLMHDIADGWTALPGSDGVYYRAVDSSDMPQLFAVLAGNVVNLRPEATLEALAELDPPSYPTLDFTAYAVQRDASVADIATAEAAWQLMQGNKATVHD